MTASAVGIDLTIRQVGALFRTGELSPVELTTTALARIVKTEPAIRAFVEIMADEAFSAAAQAEAELRPGPGRYDRGPLHGIPIGIKDIFDLSGVPTRFGSPAFADAPPASADAAAVASLREAGAVVIGKTVTQEFAAGVVSPPARNAWNPDHIPGGSSGGSAAAVAARAIMMGLGSDTGGSIRTPAGLNGVVGLKPTFGRISVEGVLPLAWSLDTIGPLTRTVEDAALACDALTTDGTGAASEIGQDLVPIRLGVARPHFFDRLQPAVRASVDTALRQLEDLGATVVEAPWPEASVARAVAFLINRAESAAVHERLLVEQPERFARLNPGLQQRLEAGRLITAPIYLRALRARKVIRGSIARLFAEHRLDALVVPTMPGTAPRADNLTLLYPDGEEPALLSYTRLTMPFNATGQPVLSLPCGFDGAGLPISIQIVGRPFGEATICRIGHAYEQAAGWHERRPPL